MAVIVADWEELQPGFGDVSTTDSAKDLARTLEDSGCRYV